MAAVEGENLLLLLYKCQSPGFSPLSGGFDSCFLFFDFCIPLLCLFRGGDTELCLWLRIAPRGITP